MKIIGFMPAWNEIDWFPYALESVYDFVDELVITEGCYSPWNNKNKEVRSTDGTLEYIQDFVKNKDKDKKIKFVTFKDVPENKSKLNVSTMIENMFLQIAKPEENDWLFRIDSDEAYKKEELDKLRKVLETTDKDTIIVPEYRFVYNFNLYMKTDHYRFFRYKNGAQFVGINLLGYPDGTLCRNKTLRLSPDICHLYHYTYVKDPYFLHNKFTSYDRDSNLHDQDRLGWFENVYLKFDENNPMKYYQLTEEYCNCFGFAWDCAASVRKFKGTHPKPMEKHPLRHKDIRNEKSFKELLKKYKIEEG